MEFWGIEIKPGSPLKVEPEDGYIIHVSQVSLGELKNVKDESVPVYVKVGDDKTKFVIGNLSEKIPQVSLDLFFEQEFEISHDCQNSSVFLLGYKTPDVLDEQVNSDFDSDEEEIPMDLLTSGLEKSNGNGVNDQKAMLEAGDDDSDEDEMGSGEDEDENVSSEEEPPSKKRPNGGAMNSTVAKKKAKVAIPQKPAGWKKSGKCLNTSE